MRAMRWSTSVAVVLILAALAVPPAWGSTHSRAVPVVSGHVVVPTAPTAVAVSPDGGLLYVVNEGNDPNPLPSITVIDARTLEVNSTVATCPGPVDVVAAGSNLLVACTGGQSLLVMDAATLTVLRIVDLGADPREVVVSPSSDRAYVLSFGARSPKVLPALIVVDIGKGKVVDRVRVGVIPQAVALSPSGKRAYVSNWGSNSVTVINTGTRKVAATLDLGKIMPGALAVNPDGSRLLVNRENAGVPMPRILTVNTESLDVVGGFRPGMVIDGMAYNGTRTNILDGYHRIGTLLLVAGRVDYQHAFAIIDLLTQRVLASIPLDAPCRGASVFMDFAIAPDEQRAYVLGECLGHPGTLTAVDLPE